MTSLPLAINSPKWIPLSIGIILPHDGDKTVPLSRIALWKSPLDWYERICMATLVDPADSPNSVTELGSPPKRAMLSWTHFIAIFWSLKPVNKATKNKEAHILRKIFDKSKVKHDWLSDLRNKMLPKVCFTQ